VALATTALWLALCVDRKFVTLKSRPRGVQVWKVDMLRLLEVLVKYGVVPPEVGFTDKAFNYVRNGYISLRRRGLKSLDYLLSSVGRFSYVLDRFCRDFPKEVGDLILEEFRPPT